MCGFATMRQRGAATFGGRLLTLILVACGSIVISLLIGTEAAAYFPEIPEFCPKELQDYIEPLNQLIFDLREVVYNELYGTEEPEASASSTANEYEILKEVVKNLDKDIKNLKEELEIVIKENHVPLVMNHKLGIDGLKLGHLEESPISQLEVIWEKIFEIVSRSKELSYVTEKIDYIKKKTVQGPEASNKTMEEKKMAPFKLERPPTYKAVLLRIREHANLKALYKEKYTQLNWLLKLNTPFSIQRRITSAFEAIISFSQNPRMHIESDPFTGLQVTSNSFIAAAKHCTIQLPSITQGAFGIDEIIN